MCHYRKLKSNHPLCTQLWLKISVTIFGSSMHAWLAVLAVLVTASRPPSPPAAAAAPAARDGAAPPPLPLDALTPEAGPARPRAVKHGVRATVSIVFQ